MSFIKAGFTSTLLLPLMCIMQSGARSQDRDSLPPVEIGGFVDSYYSLNTARPTSHTNRYRNFDLASEEFVLSEAQVNIQRRAAPIGFRVALSTGAATDIIHAGNSSTMNILMQGYLSLVVPAGEGLTVDAGKFVTHMGFETISAKDNYSYSRSFIFAWAIPYYHVGLRAAYPLLKTLTLAGSISNGWNGLTSSEGKTFGGTLAYTPLGTLTLTANWIGGPGQADSAGTFRQIVELAPVFQVSEALTLAADLIYGTENVPGQTVNWKGAALYARYAFTGNSAISARGEVYDDPYGSTTSVDQS
jgi:hypothetical protein